MNILVTIPVDQDVTARFEETAPGAAFRYVSTENVTREDIMETDILIGFVSPELIQASPRLKLFQLNLAGANTFCLPGILHEHTILIMEIVVDPQERGRGVGTQLLKELLGDKEMIGFVIQKSDAVIFPSNIASQKAFENAGYQYHHTYEDGTAMYYVYEGSSE